ncbi:hypothetical protein llap_17146 [Limosa lapponica baueri]|uniref:Uncharacterized protein n=1 Tax=Limosa lapponica baueri TaxID=1758121 RepID=A0A2I0TFH2_LIMLA|nr:hypothetical protein llap_17146 [Limosa lapponica baueri]
MSPVAMAKGWSDWSPAWPPVESKALLGKDFIFLERQGEFLSKRLVLPVALLNLSPRYSPGKRKPQDPGIREEEYQKHNNHDHSPTPRGWMLPCV